MKKNKNLETVIITDSSGRDHVIILDGTFSLTEEEQWIMDYNQALEDLENEIKMSGM